MNAKKSDPRRIASLMALLLSAFLSLGATAAVAHASGASDAPRPDPSSEPCPSSTQDPSPSPTPDPSPSSTPDPSPSPTQDPSPSPTPDPSPSPSSDLCSSRRPWPPKPAIPSATPSPDPSPGPGVTPTPTPGTHGADAGDLYGGMFTTEELDATAEALRLDGWSEELIRQRVYVPFIVVGPASWSDSWGAPRFGPGLIIRRHEGQDVLCHYGAEVLASEDGIIEFDTGLLGGRSARLHRPDGGYWYYAHLSEWNLDAFSTGDPVHAGDVIGYCGSTGNATVPHVHFGHYGPDGEAIDPMASLVSWLREAEGDLGDLPLVGTSTQVPRSTTVSEPIETPPPLIPLLGGQADTSKPIDVGGPAAQAFVRSEGRDGAFELTLVWVVMISCAWASRLLGRVVLARVKRTRTS